MENYHDIRHIEQRIQRRFRKALTDYRLISDNDHILVALSGGKDSLLLLELLAHQSRIYKPRFNVSAVHVRMRNVLYETDTQYLQSFCQKLGVDLHVITTDFEQSSDKDQKAICFFCSWNRRKQIFHLAQELKCGKIALGHHQDDIIHTTFMNLMFEGRFGSMPIKLHMRRMPLTLIRPLALQREEDIQAYAVAHLYEKQKKSCPYESNTKRNEIRMLYQQMEQRNPEIRHSIWHALEREGKLIE